MNRSDDMHCTGPTIAIRRRGHLLLLLAAAVVLWPTRVGAQDLGKAADAFQQAQAAELRGDHGYAAEMYELANRIAPSPEALRSAMRARRAAGQPAIAATHALAILERYGDDAESRKRAEAVLEELEPSLLRLLVRCPETPCTLAIDGAAAGGTARERHEVFVEPGAHQVAAVMGDRRAPARSLEGAGGQKRELVFEAPEPEPRAEEAPPKREEPAPPTEQPESSSSADTVDGPSRKAGTPAPRGDDGGAHPALFFGGVAVTLGLGAATTWAAVDTEKQADAYRDMPTRGRYESGLDRQRQTNILIAATSVVGAATALVGIFWTDWDGEPDGERGPDRARLRIDTSSHGATMAVRGRF